MTATMTAQPEPAAATWTPAERDAWRVPPPMRPSQWAEKHRTLYRSSIPGPYRLDNAPYARGLMDIPTRPGCVQACCQKGARLGWSEVLRNLIGYWAHYEPKPVGLTLPSRDEGRKVTKSEILPLFRRTKVLRDLIGASRDTLIETIDLLNGFHLGLMWSGSAAATAGKLYAVGIIDELDKTQDWAGDEPDIVGRIESRISTYGDRRLLLAGSTPTTTAGKIHQMLEQASFVLHFQVPCPCCGRFQRLVWTQFKWAKPATIDRWLQAARKAAAAGKRSFDDAGHVEHFADAKHLALRIEWLEDVRGRMAAARTKGQMADVLNYGREHLVWYQCAHCPGRIFDQNKAAVIRKGRWTTDEGHVTDYWGERHIDAESVERWPNETRIAFQLASWYSLMMHWGTIVGEFLRAEGSLTRSFNWRTERAGEPFEFQVRRIKGELFAGKCARATLDAEIVPAWAWTLLCTIDTQRDHFYAVVRAWGGGEKSQRVWHGKLATFKQVDRLLLATTWAVEGDQYPPMAIEQALIDSGGTADRWIDASRTQQVYNYVLPRQGILRAIKGANRPGPGLYWPMRNPMGGGRKETPGKRDPLAELQAWMVDTHKCNDLLADRIVRGVPRESEPSGEPELWLLNRNNDPEYNAQMAAMHKVPDKPGRNLVEVWKPVHSGARVDYRHCEAYQMALAQMAHVHLLPAEEEVLAWKRAAADQQRKKPKPPTRGGDGGDWTPRPL